MEIPRPATADKERFRALFADEPGVEVKPMFGNLGAFVNGNMFAGLFGSDIGLKLDATDQHALKAVGGGPFGPKDRPMAGYVSLPSALLGKPEAASIWVGRARDHISALPPKAGKATRRRTRA